LKLLKSSDRPEVKLVGPFIRISLAEKSDAGYVERLLDGWYRDRAEQNFAKRLVNCLSNAKSLNLDNPQLQHPQDETPLGKLHQNRSHPSQPAPHQDTWLLHRIRHHARALPPQSPQPQPRILPPPHPLHARLGTKKKAAFWIPDLVVRRQSTSIRKQG